MNEEFQDAVRGKEELQGRHDTSVRRAHDAGVSLLAIVDVLNLHRTDVLQIVQGRIRMTS